MTTATAKPGGEKPPPLKGAGKPGGKNLDRFCAGLRERQRLYALRRVREMVSFLGEMEQDLDAATGRG